MFDRILAELRYRWRALVHRRDLEDELDAELGFHLEQETRKRAQHAARPSDAARAAHLAFGGVAQVKEDTRDARGVRVIEQTWSDLRYTLRSLRVHPAFSLGVAGTLALAIGANAAIFGVVDRLMFRTPAALRDAERVHRVHMRWVEEGRARTNRSTSFPRFRDFARDTTSFDVVAAYQLRRVAIGQGDETREGHIAVVSGGFVDLFDAPPALGRWFTAAEDAPPLGTPVVVLSHAYWMTRYGGRADVLGQPIQVDRLPATIAGVAPAGFAGLTETEAPLIFVPMSAYAYSVRRAGYDTSYNWGWLEMVVRRKAGVSLEDATRDVSHAFNLSLAAETAARGPRVDLAKTQASVVLGPIHLGRGPDAGLDARVAMWILGVALLVLLIGCANVTNLHLSRAIARQRELAMRLALGAGSGRLTRQLLIESITLGMLGGLGGILIAGLSAGALRTLLLPDASDTSAMTDPRTLFYSLVLALAAGALAALVPAVLATRMDVNTALKSGGRGTTRARLPLQSALVVVQVALSVVLLLGAALFVRSLQQAQRQRLGYDVDRLAYAEVNMRGLRLPPAESTQLLERMLAAAAAVPGVTDVTTVASVPFWSSEARGLTVPGIEDVRQLGSFMFQAGSPAYFAVTGTQIRAGRAFDERDRAGTMPVVVVSEGMARTLWPGRDPLGRCLHVGDAQGPCRTVIGIAEESAMRTLEPSREYMYYVPVAQFPEGLAPQLMIRVADTHAAQLAGLRAQLQRLMPGAAYVNVVPLSELVAPSYRAWRFGATVFVAFGVLALTLASLGLYSLIAYDAAQRRQEFGVRIALGAPRDAILRLVVGRGARLAILGIAIGTGLAWMNAERVDALLFHQSIRDPFVLASIGGTLILVAVAAGMVPGLRATRVDPTEALRAD